MKDLSDSINAVCFRLWQWVTLERQLLPAVILSEAALAARSKDL